ncbi:beta strand repeat-containing protein [Oscillatoria salina]|uniref:beta strand repeat-containing protein n=1 Tax=Oscillatoria salina TaxID=331517 RepID=UPI0013BA6C73|nr:Ig-like domain-containing protein [Oscillatoria salina]MBZ8181756.1 tandem-95 repeat protein [Oscillatoria salina IIICB1]NET90391.1 tandem-95 repeat protein [Kamptonema sp. SIO1D9]
MATFNPTTTEELIQAIQDANANAEADTINLVSGATYTITGNETGVPFTATAEDPNNPGLNQFPDGVSGLPNITSEIVINGNGATIERSPTATGNFRLFYVSIPGNLTLNDVTLTNGRAEDEAVGPGILGNNAPDDGGAIFNRGTLTVNDSTFSNNAAVDDGGAIANEGQFATLTVNNTDFINNTAEGDGGGDDGGGAIDNNAGGTLILEGNTFEGNSGDEGGAIRNRGGSEIQDNGNNTFSNNEPNNVELEDDPAVDDPPFNTVPGDQNVLLGSTLTFADDVSDTGNLITVNDPDTATLDVTLTATNGTLNLGPTVPAGVTTTGDGTDTITLSGPVADLNTALDGLGFVPTAEGTGTIQIETNDGTSTDTDTVEITIAGTNNPPVFDQDPFTFDVEEASTAGTAVGTVTATDPDTGDTLTYSIIDGNTDGDSDTNLAFAIDPATGAITVNDPDDIVNGTDPEFTLTVEVEDSFGASTTATVNVNVNEVGDNPPEFSLDTFTFDIEDGSTAGTEVGTVTATDLDDDIVSYSITGGNDDGDDGDGELPFAIDPATGAITVNDPDDIVNGTDPEFTLTVEVTDANGNTDTAEVQVNIGDVTGTLIDAVDDEATTALDTPVTISILDNDTFGTLVTIEVDDDSATNGTVEINDNGTTADFSDDFLVFTPNAGFDGFEDFNYTITDETGSDTATVIVEVGGDVIATIDAVDDLAETEAATPVTIDILDNDIFDTLDSLEIEFDSVINGTVEVNDNGTTADFTDDFIVYTPDAGFDGVEDFTYTITSGDDSDTATVEITVGAILSTLDAVDDEAITDTNTPVTIPILDNDNLGDGLSQQLTIDDTTLLNGTVEINDNGTTADFSDDFVVYTPDPDFEGVEDFNYTITDGTNTDTAEVTVSIGVVDTSIDAVEDEATTEAATPVTINILDNDIFDSATLQDIQIDFAEVINGTVEINDNGTTADFSDDFVVYTPDAGFTGVEDFSYTITDDTGTDSAEVSITVGDVITTIDAVDDEATTEAATPVTINILDNDIFGTLDSLEIDFAEVINGTVEINDNGTTADFSDDFIVYTPDAGFTGVEDFTYTITDDTGTDSAEVSITVGDVITTIDAVDDEATTEAATPVTVSILDNDTFGTLENLEIDFAEVIGGTVEINDGGTTADFSDDFIVYTPDAGFTGVEDFSYTITDDTGTDSAQVSITVGDVIATIDAVDDLAETELATPVTINILDNDTFDAATLESIEIDFSDIFNGTVEINDNGTTADFSDDFIVFTPDEGFSGTEDFDYTITDGTGSDTAKVIITVDEDVVITTIDAVDDLAETDAATPITINILDNDTFDADTIEAIEVDFADVFNGTVEINDNGTTADFSDDFIVYTPDADFDGIEDFEYTITDATGSDTATVVVGVNEVVVGATLDAVDDTASAEAATPVTIDILDNDVFDTIDSLEIDFNDLLNGTVEVLDNGTPTDLTDDVIVYTPNDTFRGVERFDYTITSGDESDSASVTVTVTETDDPNQPPVAGDDTATTDLGIPVNINVLANDSDPDGDPLSLSIINAPDNGTATVNNNGTPTDLTDDFITYTPTGDFVGEDTFVYQVDDGNGGTDTATVTVTVADDGGDVVLMPPTNNVFPIGGNPNQDATLKFTLTGVDAALVNQIGVFEVDDDAGAIGTLEPGDSGYITAALNSGQVIFSALSSESPDFFDTQFLGDDAMRILSGFQGSDRLGFYLIQGSTSEAVLSGDTPQSNVLLGFASNGGDEVLSVDEISDGLFQLSFEDTPDVSGDDAPFGDLVVTAQVTNEDPVIGAGLQGEVELIDLREFQGEQLQTQIIATGEAQLDNRGGLYIVQDTDGTVFDPVTGQFVTPGQANYAEAALRNSVIEFNRVDPDVFNIAGGFLYAPYMQIGGDSDQTLFAFNEANPQGFDASRLLADNTFGFEDVVSATELSDYDDFAFQVNFAADV